MTMLRSCSMLLLAAAFAIFTFGCDKKPQKPRTEPPVETGEQAEPDAGEAEEDAQTADAADEAEPDAGEEQAADCPKPREYQGMCAQVITWARNPDTGTCCQYGSPCEAPQGWQTFNSEPACTQAGGQTQQ